MLKKYFIPVIIILSLFGCTKRTNIKPLLNSFSIIYINDWRYQQAPQIASLIKSEEQKNPVLVLVNDEIFSETQFSDIHNGLADIELMNQCQVDAVFLNSQLFKYGIQNLKDLIRKSDFSYLGANIRDRNTKQTIGPEYLFKTAGAAQIAITGIVFDTLDSYLQDVNLEIRSADFIIGKILPFIQERSDFQFLLTQTKDTLDLPFTMILQAPVKNQVKLFDDKQKGIFEITIGFDNFKNIAEIKRTSVTLDTISPDLKTEMIINNYQASIDSMFKIKLNSDNLDDKAIKILLTETKTATFLSDKPLMSFIEKSKEIAGYELYPALNQKNVLPIIRIKGDQLQRYVKLTTPLLKNIKNSKEYLILTTTDFLTGHPDLKFESVTFSNNTVWKMLLNNLK